MCRAARCYYPISPERYPYHITLEVIVSNAKEIRMRDGKHVSVLIMGPDHDFSLGMSFFKVPDCFRALKERVTSIGHRCHFARFKQLFHKNQILYICRRRQIPLFLLSVLNTQLSRASLQTFEPSNLRSPHKFPRGAMRAYTRK
jgi:hypothetical protein